MYNNNLITFNKDNYFQIKVNLFPLTICLSLYINYDIHTLFRNQQKKVINDLT